MSNMTALVLGNELSVRCKMQEEIVLKRLITALRMGTLTEQQLWSGVGEISGLRKLWEDTEKDLDKVQKGREAELRSAIHG